MPVKTSQSQAQHHAVRAAGLGIVAVALFATALVIFSVLSTDFGIAWD